MSQLNLFMTTEDEAAFFDVLFARTDTHVLRGSSFASRRPAPMSSRREIGKADALTLVNKDLMPVPRASSRGAGELTGRYVFELFRDPTIELTRSRRSKRRLVNGRLHAKIGWLKPAEANAVYQAWYRAIERGLKKHYRPV